MSLNLTNLFTALGRCGRALYIVNSSQATQQTPYTELSGFAYINESWITQLAANYDAAIRVQTAGISVWQQAAQNILFRMVAADNPTYAQSLQGCLVYLKQQMVSQGKKIKQYTVGQTVTADSANVGTGTVLSFLTNEDGETIQNLVQETTTLLITADSYTGKQTVNREAWAWSGSPALSSLGTGTQQGIFDWDALTGSGVFITGNCIDPTQDATTTGNLLTNSDFESWDTSTPAKLNNWNLLVGTWGTDAVQSATSPNSGTYCVKFAAGTGVLTALTQQFDSTISSPTSALAGTSASPSARTQYGINLYLKADGIITGGVLTIELIDGNGTVITDNQGASQTQTLALSTVTTSWAAYGYKFRLPSNPPTTLKLRIKISTALTGANLFMDDVAMGSAQKLYRGGPSAVVFANPSKPFEAVPDPDGFSLVYTNDYGGATYGASFQTLAARFFQTPDLVLPNTSIPDFADTLITNV